MNTPDRAKKVVITGASGFLGQALLRRLKDDRRFCVYALSSRPEMLEEAFAGSGMTFCGKNAVLDEGADELLRGASVLNCAFPRNSTGEDMAAGMRYIQKVFLSAADHRAEAVVNISSQSVYDPRRAGPADESAVVCLSSPYAVGKYAAELMLEQCCRNTGVFWTNIRLASLIGPGFDQRVVNRMVKQALEEGRIIARENGQIFGFMDVDDAAGALIELLLSDPTRWRGIYNLGPETGYSLIRIAEAVRAAVSDAGKTDVRLITEPGDETMNSTLDSGAFFADIGIVPMRPLEQSVAAIRDRLLGGN